MPSPLSLLSRTGVVLAVLMVCVVVVSMWFTSGSRMSDHERRNARVAAVRLLTADRAAGQMPSDLEERARTFQSGTGDRRRLLATVWAPSALERQVREMEAGWAHAVGDRDYSPYSDNRYVVTDWREVDKVRGGARVTVRGHMEYLDSACGQWKGSADGTEVLTLTRVGGDWRLLREVLEDYNPS